MKHNKSFHKFRAFTLGLLAFVTVAGANQVTLQDDADAGEKYINMPSSGSDTLSINAEDIAGGITTFKVYDNGGKNGYFSRSANGNLQLVVPKGYVFQVTGTLKVYNNAYLSIYDGGSKSSPALLYAAASDEFPGYIYSLPVLVSTDSLLTFNLVGGGLGNGHGLDLTVSLVSASTESSISVNESVGGTLTPSETQASAGSTITLTSSPTGSNYLVSIEVLDASGNPVYVKWDGIYDNTVTFNMPNSDVTVTPVWSTTPSAEAGHFANIPASGTIEVDIPAGSSLNVYDCGGKYEGFVQSVLGTLQLTAPAGYGILMTGRRNTNNGYDVLYVNDVERRPKSGGTDRYIFDFIVTDNVMAIKHDANRDSPNGYYLTVSVVDPSEKHTISVNAVAGGTITPSVSEAENNTPVTLTITPESGYMLKGISVGAGDHVIDVDWNDPFDKTATFTMPFADVTVTPVWTSNFSSEDIYVNMPLTGTKKIDIPEGMTSLMVYDFGGKKREAEMKADGYIQLTAPAGYTMEVTGSIWTHFEKDSLTIYDGNTDKAELFKGRSVTSGAELDIGTIQSSSNRLTFHLGTTYNYKGIALLVTLKPAGAFSLNYYGENKLMALIDDSYSGTDPVMTLTEDVMVDSVAFNRTFLKGGWSTIVFPFTITSGANLIFNGMSDDGSGFYRFGGVYDCEDGDGLCVKAVGPMGAINAYQPILIKVDDDKITQKKINGQTRIRATTNNVVTMGNWEFCPTLQKMAWEEGDEDLGSIYGFAAGSNSKVAVGDFVRAKAGAWIKPFRGYLKYNEPQPNYAPSIDPNERYTYNSMPSTKSSAENLPDRMRVVIVNEDENGEEHTTTIGTLDTRTGEFKMLKDYDLNGRKLNGKPTASGMYYGKKALKK